ncbi:MAG: dihydroorotate dehydrogenase electron transfer subunit [Dehalococcoidia bacterium]|nr:dihydroorotate dehydrogenase electron transfer subunit [Dehalococcoidia bacterium]
MSRHKAYVTSNTQPMPGVYLLWLEAPEVAETATPGQFVMVGCGPGLTLRRPLAVHRVNGERVALLVRRMGRGTGWLCERQPGDIVDILGPRGQGFRVEDSSRKLLLIAGGMGIAPLYFLVERALAEDRDVVLVYGCHTATAMYPEAVLPAGTRLSVATQDGTFGYHGTVTDLLQGLPSGFDQAFAAGPVEMYRALQKTDFPALKVGVGLALPVQVTLEVRLGCGFGACFGCAIPTTDGIRLVCKDGPVFKLSQVMPDGLRL